MIYSYVLLVCFEWIMFSTMKETHILKKPTKSTFEIDQDKVVTTLLEQSDNPTQICASGTFPLKHPIKWLRVNSCLAKLEMCSQFL